MNDFFDLLFQHFPLALFGDRHALKLAVSHDDCIIVAGGHAAHEAFAVGFFKIALCRDEDARRREETQKFRSGLLHEMVRHGDERLVAQANADLLHNAGDHHGSLSCAHCVRQQRIAAIEDARHGVFLVGAQRQFRVHAGKPQVAAIV